MEFNIKPGWSQAKQDSWLPEWRAETLNKELMSQNAVCLRNWILSQF